MISLHTKFMTVSFFPNSVGAPLTSVNIKCSHVSETHFLGTLKTDLIIAPFSVALYILSLYAFRDLDVYDS